MVLRRSLFPCKDTASGEATEVLQARGESLVLHSELGLIQSPELLFFVLRVPVHLETSEQPTVLTPFNSSHILWQQLLGHPEPSPGHRYRALRVITDSFTLACQAPPVSLYQQQGPERLRICSDREPSAGLPSSRLPMECCHCEELQSGLVRIRASVGIRGHGFIMGTGLAMAVGGAGRQRSEGDVEGQRGTSPGQSKKPGTSRVSVFLAEPLEVGMGP